jgi:hypothetical protein
MFRQSLGNVNAQLFDHGRGRNSDRHVKTDRVLYLVLKLSSRTVLSLRRPASLFVPEVEEER